MGLQEYILTESEKRGRRPIFFKSRQDKIFDKQIFALKIIKKGMQNWLYSPMCKDGTIGIVPRVAMSKLGLIKLPVGKKYPRYVGNPLGEYIKDVAVYDSLLENIADMKIKS